MNILVKEHMLKETIQILVTLHRPFNKLQGNETLIGCKKKSRIMSQTTAGTVEASKMIQRYGLQTL